MVEIVPFRVQVSSLLTLAVCKDCNMMYLYEYYTSQMLGFVTSQEKYNRNQCWSELFELFDYLNSKDQIAVFGICVRSFLNSK